MPKAQQLHKCGPGSARDADASEEECVDETRPDDLATHCMEANVLARRVNQTHPACGKQHPASNTWTGPRTSLSRRLFADIRTTARAIAESSRRLGRDVDARKESSHGARSVQVWEREAYLRRIRSGVAIRTLANNTPTRP